MDVIRTDNLAKRYGNHIALCNVNLHVAAGCRFGFLGPNGAGKTTTIRILLGLLRASSGQARVLDLDVWQHGPRLRQQIGYLPGDVRFYSYLTGRQTLDYFAGVRRTNCRAEIRRLSSAFNLDLDRRVRVYSRGMKQKLGLIQALMHRPQLVILDEPTIGLDPLIRAVLYEELRRVTADGRTVLFSSHTLSEVDELCEQVAILRNGQLIEQEQIVVLRRQAVRRVDIQFRAAPTFGDPPSALKITHRAERNLRGTWAGPANDLLQWLALQSVEDVSIAPPDLEDLFLAYYTDPPPEDRA